MKNKNLIDSFKHAFEGFKTCVYKERNIKIHLCVMFLVILFGIILEISKYEIITCLILYITYIIVIKRIMKMGDYHE